MAINSEVTDEQMFKDALERAIAKQLMPPVSPFITAPLGTALNKDLTNLNPIDLLAKGKAPKDIVNVAQSKELSFAQYNKNTSELSKLIGKEANISPLKADYFLRTMFGSYMGVTATLSNGMIAEKQGKSLPAKESNALLESLGFGSYLSKPGTPNVVPDLYTAAHEVDKTLPTILSLAKSGQKKESHDLKEEKGFDIKGGKEAIKYENILNQYNRQENTIRNRRADETVEIQGSPFYGKPYTPEVKKAMIDELDKKRIALTPKVMELRKKIYEK